VNSSEQTFKTHAALAVQKTRAKNTGTQHNSMISAAEACDGRNISQWSGKRLPISAISRGHLSGIGVIL
jgi:hypothetical protein